MAVKLKLAERKASEALLEERIRQTFETKSKLHERIKHANRVKKKTAQQLLFMLSLKGRCLYDLYLHEPDSYFVRSHNLDRQLIGLINHMFVKYPVPDFMYQVFFDHNADPFNCMRDVYQNWFVTLAQGGSFPSIVKGIMTSKEASVFLRAPADARVHENVWWAKLTVAGVPHAIRKLVIQRALSYHYFDDPNGRMAEVVTFYANQHQNMGQRDAEEITDFIGWKLRNDASFRLKGRTAASVLKLSNEWHLLIQKAKLGTTVEWDGLGCLDWQHVIKKEVFIVQELRNNQELINEGRKQKHCVYSYVSACSSGRSAIFSLRAFMKVFKGEYGSDMQPIYDKSFELSRITIEVQQGVRQIVQVRGPLNRAPSDDEKKVVKIWAGEKGFSMSQFAMR